MPTPTLLVSTWYDGLFTIAGDGVRHDFAGQPVRGLVADGQGGAFAIVGGDALWRRSAEGTWSEVARSASPLACCAVLSATLFVGTDDAHMLRVDPDGTLHRLAGFDTVAGRDRWYAGAAIVDGKLMGPPLGIRSVAASCDGAVLFANVHVGGIPRSTDAGRSWHPTIAVDDDAHQVCTHPTRSDLVIAATAVGLSISRDGGATWTVERRGLHADHCSAVAFGRTAMFVSASVDPFATQGAVYARPIDGDGPLDRPEGLPYWFDGIVDTGCIAARDAMIAIIDRGGSLHLSDDDGASWSCPAERVPVASGLLIG